MAKKEIGRMSCPSCQAEHQVVFDDGFKCFSPCEVCGVETRFQKRQARDAIRARFQKPEQPSDPMPEPEPVIEEPPTLELPAKAEEKPAETGGLFF